MKTFKGYMHGINLGGWLSQCDHTKERYDTFVVEDDIKKISEWGLDHIRVPIDYELVEDKEGNYLEEGFEYSLTMSFIRKGFISCGNSSPVDLVSIQTDSALRF